LNPVDMQISTDAEETWTQKETDRDTGKTERERMIRFYSVDY